MSTTLFTPAAARAAASRLAPSVASLTALYRRLEREGRGLAAADRPVPSGYWRGVRRLHAVLEAIRSSGARIEDPRDGVLAFPARRSGRDVVLLWRAGAADDTAWSALDAGPPRREGPVEEDGPWEGEGI